MYAAIEFIAAFAYDTHMLTSARVWALAQAGVWRSKINTVFLAQTIVLGIVFCRF